jgi:hypothetical protein
MAVAPIVAAPAAHTSFRKLGKKAPKHDCRTLHLGDYLRAAQLPAPAPVDWTIACKQPWGMMLNDRIGCCGISTLGHGIQVLTGNGGAEQTIPDSTILNAYVAVTGREGGAYNPRTGANDNGTVLIDDLNQWRAGMHGHQIAAYASVRPSNQTHVMQAIDLFGGIAIGVSLPNTAQEQLNANQPWDYVPNGGAAAQPGSWGGHAIWVAAVDSTGLVCITWGARQAMTWAFFTTYCDEAYAVISHDFIKATGTAPSGFDFATLQADLSAVTN